MEGSERDEGFARPRAEDLAELHLPREDAGARRSAARRRAFPINPSAVNEPRMSDDDRSSGSRTPTEAVTFDAPNLLASETSAPREPSFV